MAYKSNTERVSEIREKLKSTFPDFKFSVRKSGYNGVYISVLEAPIDLMVGSQDEYVDVNRYYIDSHYKDYPEVKDILKKIDNIASEGVTYRETGDYGNQPDFYVYIRIGESNKPFKYVPKKGKSSGGWKKSSSAPKKEYPKGDLVKECEGWKIYQKTLPDGRKVWNAYKNADTPPNKGDWNAIKGEIYTETGFKWGKFGAFEKWGQLASDEQSGYAILEKLCSIFDKYYSSTPTTNNIPIDIYINGEFFSAVPSDMDASIMLGAKYGGQKYNEMVTSGKIVKTSNRRLDVTELEPQTPMPSHSSTTNRIPSTDPFTWDATYKIGDRVKVRIDFDQIMKQMGFSVDAIFEITSKVYERDMVRPENPSGTLYILNNGQQWEGKDLELAGTDEQSNSFTKEDIEKTIIGFQYLADSGDADAIAIINGLKYLI